MKVHFLRRSVVFVLAASAMATAVPARADYLIIVGENGSGVQKPDGANAFPFMGALIDDPGPGGLKKALTFDIPTFDGAGYVKGDVFVFDKGNIGAGKMDQIRFNGTTLVFYSVKEKDGDKADIGFPTKQYDNDTTAIEMPNGLISYTPRG